MTDIGRIDPIKKHLLTMIENADPTIHAYPDWRMNITRIRNFPIATVRIMDAMMTDEVYGRKFTSSEEGSIGAYRFSIHVFASNCKVGNEAKAKYALESADKIITYLKQNRRNSTYGIYDISDISARESEPANAPFNISRVIIEGNIWAKRPDS